MYVIFIQKQNASPNLVILPTYWAQEMIGADLLREKLKKAKPVEKHLVAVFDSPKRNHDVKVRNLISGEGKQAVLPELGNRISNRDGSRFIIFICDTETTY